MRSTTRSIEKKIPFLSGVERFLRKKKIITEKLERLARADENIKKIDIFGLIETYNLLSDDLSKKTFIDVLKYRLANTDGILPPVFTEKKKELEEIFNNGKYTAVKLYSARIWEKEALFNLHFLNRNLEFYSTVFLIFCNLYLKQYEYHQNGVSIAIQPGDYVIDGGGFMGETALVFADDVGEDGRIFSFECSSNNSQKFEMNIDLNLRLKNRIQVIERALWNNSNDILHLTEQGGGAFCSTETSSETVQVQTIAIDDFMAENNIPKLDLIKLDIEGAELECLRGASNTIKKFKPNLAICVYHKAGDMVTIPQYIKALVPEYKLYLKHNSYDARETVVYATKNG